MADGWGPPTAGFLYCILFGTVLGIACTLIIVFNHDDLPRCKGAVGLGGIAWFLGALTWLWFVMISTHRGDSGSGAVMVVGAGLAYGLIMTALVALPRYVTPERPPGSSADDLDSQTS